MHTAQVTTWGSAPKYISVPTPTEPTAASNQTQITLVAAGLHNVVRSRASGAHYSASTLPHIPGIDGVGTTPSGQAVYFSTLSSGGSFSEILNIPNSDITPLPEGLDPIQVAGLMNPALSSWMALKTRTGTSPLRKGFTVLVMGATSASGSIAISLARSFGAGKVVGVARNFAALEALELDEKIQLLDPVEQTDFSKLGDVDVVLDYLYGAPMVHLLKSLRSRVTTNYVHIGSLAGLEVALPGAVLRGNDVVIRGSGKGAWSLGQLRKEYPELLVAMKGVKRREVKVEKLSDIERVWGEGSERMVFVP